MAARCSYHEVCLGLQFSGKWEQIHHSDSFIYLKKNNPWRENMVFHTQHNFLFVVLITFWIYEAQCIYSFACFLVTQAKNLPQI